MNCGKTSKSVLPIRTSFEMEAKTQFVFPILPPKPKQPPFRKTWIQLQIRPKTSSYSHEEALSRNSRGRFIRKHVAFRVEFQPIFFSRIVIKGPFTALLAILTPPFQTLERCHFSFKTRWAKGKFVRPKNAKIGVFRPFPASPKGAILHPQELTSSKETHSGMKSARKEWGGGKYRSTSSWLFLFLGHFLSKIWKGDPQRYTTYPLLGPQNRMNHLQTSRYAQDEE